MALTWRATGLAIAVLPASATFVASIEAAPLIKLVPVLTGLAAPVFVTNARDGSNRLFVLEQGGLIKVLQPGRTSPTIFLDIRPRVLSGGERGLLGLTFHPQFSSNRRFFVSYTRRPDVATVIAEYAVSAGDSNIADPTETVLLVIQPFVNHHGGMVEFGPDGFLYIATGDGGAGNDPGNRAQDINQLLGKILRIDVDHADPPRLYSSPPSNPFAGAIPGADEIYAHGLRNPWRFSFDRRTGELYAADVGQDAVEEINLITLGGNYGWRIWEGSHCTGIDPGLCTPAGFIFPIAEYRHTAGRCAIIGGYVYRGTRSSLPAGSYVYGDICTGEIFVLQNGTSGIALVTAPGISSFGEDESGEVYVVGLGGTVHRIASANEPNDMVVAAVLPLSRSVQIGGAPVTAFAAIINVGSAVAVNCRPAAPASLPAGLGSFVYQTTTDNVLTGTPNTPANIASGATQHYVFGFSPTAPLVETSLTMRFLCDNVAAADSPEVNNFFLVASSSPVPDTIALMATVSGDGVVRIPGSAGTQLLAIGTSNVGATGTIVVSGDTGGVSLPLTLTVCETGGSGTCLAPPTPTLTVDYTAGTNRSFAFFAQAAGAIPFDPANTRVFARLRQSGVLRGATSAAVCTTPNAGC